jgi:putative FmdB family regulatory protein
MAYTDQTVFYVAPLQTPDFVHLYAAKRPLENGQAGRFTGSPFCSGIAKIIVRCYICVMPTYEYECKSCSHTFEAFQSMNDAPLTSCPVCGKGIRRLIHGGTGVIFKGSGFYVTDKSNKNKKTVSGAAPKDGSSSGSGQTPASGASAGGANTSSPSASGGSGGDGVSKKSEPAAKSA